MSRIPRVAFVMAAGLGTRMRPLTEILPKPLLPLFGKPLIAFAFDHLIAHGVTDFVVNTHHLPEAFPAHFPIESYRGMPLRFVHEPVRLETGGGIQNAGELLGNEPFWVYSGDVLTDIDLTPLAEAHARDGNLVTLALRQTGFSPSIRAESGLVTEIRRGISGPDLHDFANVSVWSPEALRRLPPGQKAPFIPLLAEWIREGARIGGVVCQENDWFNIGTPEDYLAIHGLVHARNWQPAYGPTAGWPERIAPSAVVPPSVSFEGFVSVGENCRIGEAAGLRDCILLPGAKTASRVHLSRCIVCGSAEKSAENAIL